MNDPKIGCQALKDLIQAARDASTVFERASIWAAAKVLAADFERHLEEEQIGGSAYLEEKLSGVVSHIGAMTGFDITNGHSAASHHSWALGDLSVFEGNLLKAA